MFGACLEHGLSMLGHRMLILSRIYVPLAFINTSYKYCHACVIL